MSKEPIKLNNVYNDYVALIPVSRNMYQLETDTNYRIIYDKINGEEVIKAVDPMGGPLIMKGLNCGGKKVIDIKHLSEKIYIYLEANE